MGLCSAAVIGDSALFGLASLSTVLSFCTFAKQSCWLCLCDMLMSNQSPFSNGFVCLFCAACSCSLCVYPAKQVLTYLSALEVYWYYFAGHDEEQGAKDLDTEMKPVATGVNDHVNGSDDKSESFPWVGDEVANEMSK